MRAIVHVRDVLLLAVDRQPVKARGQPALMRSDPEPQVGSCTV